MAKKKSSTLTFIIVYGLANCLLALLLFLFWGLPGLRMEQRVKTQFQAEQKRVQESADLIRSVPNPLKERQEIEARIEEFKKTGLSGKQLPRILQALGQSAQEHAITILSLRPRDDMKPPAELPAGVNKLYIEMSVEASYRGISEYIKYLQSHPASFSIESIGMSRKQSAAAQRPGQKAAVNDSELLQVDMVLSTFVVWEL